MQIQSGKLYENRTWKYLYPCLKHYGDELMDKLSSFFKVAVGVHDHNRKEDGNCIYILIDTNIPLASDYDRQEYKRKFTKFLDWVSYKHYYVTDYIFEKDKHMIVLRLPHDYDITYINFVNGKYSKMYPQRVVNEYFKYITISNKEIEDRQNSKIRTTRAILTKNKSYLPTFVDIVNKDFNTDITVEDYKDAELDYPPKKEEEIFNYSKEEEV